MSSELGGNPMSEVDFIKTAAICAREWRDRVSGELAESGCTDLSYQPKSGMSSIGWVLAHQAAVLDFTLNGLIKRGSPKNPRMGNAYAPGTSGAWDGTSLEEIHEYYDSGEYEFLEWVGKATPDDLARVIQEGEASVFFVGMTIRKLIATMFAHINYHTGHLQAAHKDWLKGQAEARR